MISLNELTSAAKGVSSTFAADPSSKATSAPFSSLLQSIISQNQVLEQKATDAVTGLMTGQGVEVHDALIATQKASLAFELALQIRNKAVAAYQQMMGMQF